MLRTSLAKKIIREVKSFIKEDLIMVDTSGTIIASTDPARIGNYHEGAFIAASEKEMKIITQADEKVLEGVKAGITLPLFHQQRVVGVIGITGTPEKVLPYGELIKKMTELLIQENYYQDQFEWEARSLETFVFDWLLKDGPSSALQKRAEVLGVNMEVSRQVVLIEFQGDSTLLQPKRWNFSEQNIGLNEDDILVQWGHNRMILLLEKREKNILPFLERLRKILERLAVTSVFIGAGKDSTMSSVKESYLEAERALGVCNCDLPIVLEENLRLEMILQSIPKPIKEEFSGRILSQVLGEKELMDTIHVYLEKHSSLKETAAELHIHINTLHYRLKKFETLTNLNLKEVRDVTSLYLSLLFLDEHTK
ncbi:carbohydrate diacid regulator [Bacillus tianshenii]|uniref:Carbohydrate diacid regulator n=1 Tax=Sutcliffiella tianshenii TaxID=1463404 RepID=A0ABS2NYR7_9BACI|nr:sugar diacid recognition domain-containing protein [Bacillus tianshenii]MBM7619800.1 carbohydrate diacid regulator [Bacillus tianshenii]